MRVNDEWEKFAREDGNGSEVASAAFIGRSIWSFIGDPSLCQLYREFVNLARKGRQICFSFRCDAAAFRRLFEMRITGEETGLVEFASTLQSETPRDPVPLLDFEQQRNDQFLRMCSWCQRVKVGIDWMQVEEAVIVLGLMTAATVPAITHGICEDCDLPPAS